MHSARFASGIIISFNRVSQIDRLAENQHLCCPAPTRNQAFTCACPALFTGTRVAPDPFTLLRKLYSAWTV